jgi:nucleotide-binding universal stress UspA family protein
MVPTPGVAAGQEQTLSPISALRLARIMVATDFSPASDRALEYGISLARRYQSWLYLTHVVALSPIMAPELAAASEMKLRAAAERALGEIVESGRLLGVPHEELIEQGTL